MKAYILFQIDVTKRNRAVFVLAFILRKKAITTAKENDLLSNRSEVVIIKCDIDKFKEL